MTGLVVGMTGGTGLRTETLAIANNSLGRLHLTGATRTGTGRSGSHHNQSTHCCLGRKKMTPEQTHHFHTQFMQNIDNDSHPRQDAGPGTWKPESIKILVN